jgi:hypothetical protein
MILPAIKLKNKIDTDSFYFGCDSTYFNLYGKPLAASLKHFAPWANIHIHIFNPTDSDITWCKTSNVTYSFETFTADFKEINTYYACVRFIRIPEIFSNSARVIALDCDGIAVNLITKDKFLKDTEKSAVLWRTKNQRVLASSIFFGTDEFRDKLAKRLIPHFETDSFKWFLDQVVMAEMMHNNEVSAVEFRDWGNPKIGVNTLIWTLKGDQKHNLEFQKLITYYTK